MSDTSTTIEELKRLVHNFVAERNWEQFHAPKNLSMALAIEAAELMEHFQWIDLQSSREVADNPDKLAAVGEELADVVAYSLALADVLGIDVADTVRAKMVKNVEKYPADEYRGRYGSEDGGE
jgi:NTP pyrophosphatase (non-canonical NTP hydrolase)